MSISLGALSVTDLSTNGLLFEIREGKPFTLAEYRDRLQDKVTVELCPADGPDLSQSPANAVGGP